MMAPLQRRRAIGAVAGCAAGLLGLQALAQAATRPSGAAPWPAWERFQAQFVSAHGRVVDGEQTVSEAQAYALFFALVANDQAGFERLLRWTEEQLCQGDLARHLPAWQWGRQDAQWGVIDTNPAADADLWLAYALGEAGRLWNQRRYSALSSLVSARVLREECAELPGLGLCLLPGPKGFVTSEGRWRLNPSYSPPQLLQWLAHQADQPQWRRVAQSTSKVITGSAPQGFAADWMLYDAEQGFLPDLDGPQKTLGSYNAIRVYLWAGMLHADAPERAALLHHLRPMAEQVRKDGGPPEAIDILTGQATGQGPSGFCAALLPFLQAQQDSATLELQRAHLAAHPLRDYAYFEQALALFALGFMEGHYRFAANGQLQTRWNKT